MVTASIRDGFSEGKFIEMDKLDFLVVGTQKGGTTSLDRYLRKHPQIEMPHSKKELHFFDTDKFFISESNYDSYHRHFKWDSKKLVRGEVTPVYMYWIPAIERVWHYNPAIKIIMVLRNPIDRAYSHWNMVKEKGFETLSFSEAIRIEHQRCKAVLPQQSYRFSYIDRGYYSEQLRRVLRFFPQNQVLVVKSEWLKNNSHNVVEAISSFLQIDSFPQVEKVEANSRYYLKPMSNEDRSYLKDIFYYDIRMLEQMLGWDCQGWYE